MKTSLLKRTSSPWQLILRGVLVSILCTALLVVLFALIISVTAQAAPCSKQSIRMGISVTPAIGASAAPTGMVNRPICIFSPQNHDSACSARLPPVRIL